MDLSSVPRPAGVTNADIAKASALLGGAKIHKVEEHNPELAPQFEAALSVALPQVRWAARYAPLMAAFAHVVHTPPPCLLLPMDAFMHVEADLPLTMDTRRLLAEAAFTDADMVELETRLARLLVSRPEIQGDFIPVTRPRPELLHMVLPVARDTDGSEPIAAITMVLPVEDSTRHLDALLPLAVTTLVRHLQPVPDPMPGTALWEWAYQGGHGGHPTLFLRLTTRTALNARHRAELGRWQRHKKQVLEDLDLDDSLTAKELDRAIGREPAEPYLVRLTNDVQMGQLLAQAARVPHGAPRTPNVVMSEAKDPVSVVPMQQ